MAYKTEMSTASGSAQITATASGKGAEANGVATANDLMQQAAALVK